MYPANSMVAKSILKTDAFVIFTVAKTLSVACLIITHLPALYVSACTKPAGHIYTHACAHSESSRAFLFLFTPSSIIHSIRLSLHAHKIRHIHTHLTLGVWGGNPDLNNSIFNNSIIHSHFLFHLIFPYLLLFPRLYCFLCSRSEQ